ncbi:MAG: hypothetical protein MHM6MM_006098 [Cercozoa sp. M6MM]
MASLDQCDKSRTDDDAFFPALFTSSSLIITDDVEAAGASHSQHTLAQSEQLAQALEQQQQQQQQQQHEDEEERKQVRRIFLTASILAITVATTLFILTFAVRGSAQKTATQFWFSWNPDLVWLLPFLTIDQLLLYGVGVVFKWLCFIRWYHVPRALFQRAIGPRRNWGGRAELERIREVVGGDRVLKRMDGLPRKALHMITIVQSSLLLGSLFREDVTRVQTIVVLQSLNVLIGIWFLKSEHVASKLFYHQARLRDGRWGRHNLLLVRSTTLCASISLSSLTFWMRGDLKVDEDDARLTSLLLLLALLPTAVGDALGEVVGSLWGTHQCRVWGIGQINRKSIEGSTAVFLGTLVSQELAVLSFATRHLGGFQPLLFLSASISTVLELASPRATDNGVLPISNFVLVWVYLRNNRHLLS